MPITGTWHEIHLNILSSLAGIQQSKWDIPRYSFLSLKVTPLITGTAGLSTTQFQNCHKKNIEVYKIINNCHQ